GSLVMYELRDAIGEENVNRALAKFVKEHAFEQPPYTNSAALVKEFRAVAPADKQQLITDLFENIVLYDNKTTTAESTKLANGQYRIKITVTSKKFRSDAGGNEKEVPLDDWIDVGVLGDGGKLKTKDDKVLAMEKHRITKPEMTFEFTVKEKPTRAGIDPLNKLIDRNPDDNTKKL
ncbi:MAG: hypothetical protein ABI837_08205, partial [Acidobacteriota bacterium]